MRAVLFVLGRAAFTARTAVAAASNDVIGIAGLVFVCYGVSLWSLPAGYIAGGFCLVLVATVRGR